MFDYERFGCAENRLVVTVVVVGVATPKCVCMCGGHCGGDSETCCRMQVSYLEAGHVQGYCGISFLFEVSACPGDVVEVDVELTAVFTCIVAWVGEFCYASFVPGCSLLDHFDDAGLILRELFVGCVGCSIINRVELLIDLSSVSVGARPRIGCQTSNGRSQLLEGTISNGQRGPPICVNMKVFVEHSGFLV